MTAPKNNLTGDAVFPTRTLRGQLTISGSGAVSAFAGFGIVSCTKVNATTGQYKLVLDGSYVDLVGFKATPLASTLDTMVANVKAHDVTSTSDPYVTMFTYNPAAGTAVDPASATVILIEIVVSDVKK